MTLLPARVYQRQRPDEFHITAVPEPGTAGIAIMGVC